MGRELRKVPKGWEHPLENGTGYKPLLDSFERDTRDFDKREREEGLPEALDWFGQRPDSKDYIGVGWKEEDRVLCQMYETTTEGTPLSPAFGTKEELAHWLADNKASAFGAQAATYDAWLEIMGS